MKVTLRDYQQAAFDKARDAVRNGARRILICAPTGGGKTVLASALMEMVKEGYRAALLFTVQHHDATEVRPADRIDPVYGSLLRQAATHGVELLAYQAFVSPEEIRLTKRLPVNLS